MSTALRSIVSLLLLLGCLVWVSAAAAQMHTLTPWMQDWVRELENLIHRSTHRSVSRAIVDYRTSNLNDPWQILRYADADVVVLESMYLWSSPNNAGIVAALKACNPDIVVLGYVNAHTTWLRWGVENNPAKPTNPYGYAWYNATRPYWSWTTTGDTVMTWPGKVMLNVCEPACRKAMISILAEYQETSPNRLDGVFWDCFNDPLWISPDAKTLRGEVDLDGDGLGYDEDTDEREAYRRSQADLVRETRQTLGDGFIQVFNGARALADSAFAALSDGMMYENFPFVGFWGGHEMAQALDPTLPHNLFTARSWPRRTNGGPYVILSNKDEITFQDQQGPSIDYPLAYFNQVVALLTDCAVSFHSDGLMTYGKPLVDIDLGHPLGPPERNPDGFQRQFAKGSVTMSFAEITPQVQMSYEIVYQGRVIQSFHYPHHFPRHSP